MPITPAPGPAGFARRFSLEATRPDAAEIARLAAILPPGTEVYVTAVPTVGPAELIGIAATLRKAGLEPVAHIAARRLPSAEALAHIVTGLAGDAGVRRLLVIGGDIDNAGPFSDALAVIQKGRLMSGVATGLIGHVGPDRILEALAATGGLGDIAPHYFSFGGAVETARYACEAAHGTHAAGHAMPQPH